MDGLINLIILFIITGILMWIVNAYIPMPRAIKSLLNLLVMIVLIIWVLEFFGLIRGILPIPVVPIPHAAGPQPHPAAATH